MNDTKILDGIAIFVEVVNNKSFSQAAMSLGHSASHVSKEINRLEERLGVRLLHRTTRTLSLTAEGEIYFQQCQQIIDDAIEIENTLSGKQDEPQGKLKLSCPISFGISRVRPIIAEFMSRYPKIDLELDLNDHKVDIIAEGFDLVIRASNQLEDSSLISRRFMKSVGVTIASPDYLKRYGTPLKPEELIHHKTICYRNLKQPNVWQFIDNNGKKTQVNVKSKVLTNSPEMEIALCIAGQGIIRMPKFNLADEIETGKLVPLFPTYQEQEIGVYLVYPSRKHLSAKVKCFIDFVIEKLGD